jgi:hypothetical protein
MIFANNILIDITINNQYEIDKDYKTFDSIEFATKYLNREMCEACQNANLRWHHAWEHCRNRLKDSTSEINSKAIIKQKINKHKRIDLKTIKNLLSQKLTKKQKEDLILTYLYVKHFLNNL